MIALGTLVAQVCFTSWRRRLAFLAVSCVLPILANGVRAWGTIYIAQFRGVEFAEGFDHIFYGWIFFALVMAVLLGLGWRFFDRAADDPLIDGAAIAKSSLLARASQLRVNGWLALAMLAALALAAGTWAARAEALAAPVPQRIDLPEVRGWQSVDYTPELWWEPRAQGPIIACWGAISDAQGHTVDVFFALYSAQGDGREAGGFGEAR